MKLTHISDLHLGISVYGYSFIEDQKYILKQIIDITKEEKADGIIIAGDIYDKAIAPVEAIRLFEDFLEELVKLNIKIYIISGNHDNADRLTFGSDFMKQSGIFFSQNYNGNVEKASFTDDFGLVNIYLLPFIRPQTVRAVFAEKEITDYESALKTAVESMNINVKERNILVTHQNIVNASHCDSEELIFGGLDAINAEVFSDFDYVALGHIHSPQHIKKENIRYCGTPLKYSTSEINQKKSISVIELKEKGSINIYTRALTPLREMRQIKGLFEDIIKNSEQDKLNHNDYVNIVLTDENDVSDAMARIRQVYPFALQIEYDNFRTQHIADSIKTTDVKKMNPLEVFSSFYKDRTEKKLSIEENEYIKSLIEEIWENEE